MAVFDKFGMYENIESLHYQVEKGYALAKDVMINPEIKSIVVAGVGGSILSGHILKQYLHDFKIPVFVVEDFLLPKFVDQKSLVFVLSYSGNIDESISVFRDAVKRQCQVIAIGGGGKLREIASFNRTRYILVPGGIPSRLAYPLLFFPMLRILENSGLIQSHDSDVNRISKILKNNKFDDVTGGIVDKLIGKIPLIYASPNYEVVALKWKLNFNENTELPSFYGVLPGAAYNELAHFSENRDIFYVLLIKSEEDELLLKKNNATVKSVLRDSGIPVTEIGVTGESYLVRLFSAMFIGDWLSYNLAIKRGVDPTPTKIVEEIKKRMQA